MEKYTLLKQLEMRAKLLAAGVTIFTPSNFEALFNTPPLKTKYILETQVKNGLFIRFKKGLYGLKTDLPNEEYIANRLYTPSYISFEYALSHYGVIVESVYHVTSATTKPTRLYKTPQLAFFYYTLKKTAYTGYYLKESGKNAFFIAEPEKALADYLYFVNLGKKSLLDRFYLTSINKEKLLSYTELFKRKELASLVDKIYDKLRQDW